VNHTVHTNGLLVNEANPLNGFNPFNPLHPLIVRKKCQRPGNNKRWHSSFRVCVSLERLTGKAEIY
jgi:hypothetical protein